MFSFWLSATTPRSKGEERKSGGTEGAAALYLFLNLNMPAIPHCRSDFDFVLIFEKIPHQVQDDNEKVLCARSG